jgi:hypothetical protein
MSAKVVNALIFPVTVIAVVITLFLRPTDRIDLQVFWQTSDLDMTEKATVFRSVTLDDTEQTLEVNLQGRGVLRLRIDLAHSGEEFTEIRISNARIEGMQEGKPASVEIPPIWYCFNCSLVIEGNTLRIRSDLEDPYILSERIPYMNVDTLRFEVSGVR